MRVIYATMGAELGDMRRCLVAVAALCMVTLVAVCTGTALDDYVNKADNHYTYKATGHYTKDNCSIYTLNMTSQKWMDEQFSSRPIWVHDMMVVIPNQIISRDTAILVINGGSNHKSFIPDDITSKLSCVVAQKSKTIAVLLKQIPNEPIKFMGDPQHISRREDEIIAWTWKTFLSNVSQPEVLLRLPMTKAVVRAMDTVSDFTHRIPGSFNITKFAVTGASKRGWVAWTVPAVDKRVIALSPIVLDILNLKKSLHHQFKALGNWSFAMKAYFDCDVMRKLDSPELEKMMSIIDPYSYRDRLTMPKYVVTAAGDEFFPPDDSHYYFDQLKGSKYLRIVPNAEHTIFGHYLDVVNSITAFYQAVYTKFPLPKFTWERRQTSVGGKIMLHAETKPVNVKAYYARTISNKRRDFRWLIGRPGDTSKPYPQPILWFSDKVINMGDGTYVAEYRRPLEGWFAFMIEISFSGPSGTTLKFTTGLNIIPDVFPFADCYGDSCRGGLV